MTGRDSTIGRILAAMLLAGALTALLNARAHAAVSPNDGYASDGTYQWHFELAPYGWVPATSADIKLGNGANVNINAGMPTLSQLKNVLTGAFMGFGLVRYGPWSAQINIQYIAASQTKGLPPGPDETIGRTLDVSSSMVRVVPGFGYEVYRGAVGKVPTTLDGLIGFSYFTDSTSLDLSRFGPTGEKLGVSSVSDSIIFVQPWLGFRASIYPWPRWRFQLEAMVQGLGVDGGSWGWGAGVYATWAATKWLNLVAGFNALNSQGRQGSGNVIRSVNITEYGPLLGMSFTF